MKPNTVPSDFLRRINPQPQRIGYADTPKGWRDLPRMDYHTWFIVMEPGLHLWLELGGIRLQVPGGHGILVRPGTWVSRWLEPGAGGRRYWITFDWDSSHPAAGSPPLYAPARPDATLVRRAPRWIPDALWARPLPLPAGFHEDFLRLNDRFWLGGAASRGTARGLLLEFLLKMLGPACSWSEAVAPDQQTATDQLLERLREAALLPFTQAPDVQTLLEASGQSHDHAGRLFRQAFGLTPLAYLNRLRMERAKRLLEDTGLGVIAISRQLGYSDFRYFSRLFRQTTGQTPQTYRSHIR